MAITVKIITTPITTPTIIAVLTEMYDFGCYVYGVGTGDTVASL